MLKLFISYSHKDENHINKFLNHLAPFKNNGIIDEWYDRKILTGENFQDSIDNNLDEADFILLAISDNFLASPACIEEKDRALTLYKKNGIRVIPVILSPCLWHKHKELSELLAVPTDGKPITKFDDVNSGWLNVLEWLEKVIEEHKKIHSLELKEDFLIFLESTDILSKSHKSKDLLKLEDIFTYPILSTYDDKESRKRYNSVNLPDEILEFGKVIIAGEKQSGKTAMCKILFSQLRKLNFVPIYIRDKNKFLGNPENLLQKAYSEQYSEGELKDFNPFRIVPIIDDFHFAKHQEKIIYALDKYNTQLIIVDDIFGLNFNNQNLIIDYQKFKIREFTAIERDELIKKWIRITEESKIQINPNHLQKSVDDKTELIERSLGKILGKGIMPSYPFFILSLLAAQDIQKPLDQEITSQGHCYQALIYLYLRKEGVTNEQIDIYSNFLTELAFFIYSKKSTDITDEQFDEFLNYYTGKFNLPISVTKIVQTLANVNICKFDSFNQFGFSYEYIFYFFIAKYISENIDQNKAIINYLTANLHKDENAYITIFIAHHTKSSYILEELLLNAQILFEEFEPSSLNSEELSFFDKNEDKIIKALLPEFNHDTDQERKKILQRKAELEEDETEEVDNSRSKPKFEHREWNDEEMDEIEKLDTNLRLSMKTVEVMGTIIKNRSGSLNLESLENIFNEGMKVHLRILSSFLNVIKDEDAEKGMVEFLKERLDSIKEEREENERELKPDEIEKLARKIFWNLNFGVVHGVITKAIHSLGSSNLLTIAENVSTKEGTPSSFIVNHGIRMWYGKNLRVKEIAERIEKNNFSKTAESLIKYKIVEHVRLHKIGYKELRKIEKELNLSSRKLLVENKKKN
ncbi:TIR domain-containing protein [Salegentibacter mishustinae]|uniref:TIR domain-containing protein n=1 Tax=Salegentibacter mishustinae TaxID=270918 RepID=UPI002492B7E8|nr:toll/interleukin-1 receptor domain-containing protein [Salegentibacter mishustinae]